MSPDDFSAVTAETLLFHWSWLSVPTLQTHPSPEPHARCSRASVFFLCLAACLFSFLPTLLLPPPRGPPWPSGLKVPPSLGPLYPEHWPFTRWEIDVVCCSRVQFRRKQAYQGNSLGEVVEHPALLTRVVRAQAGWRESACPMAKAPVKKDSPRGHSSCW